MGLLRTVPVLLVALTLLAACGDDGGSNQDEDEAFDPPSTTEEVETELPEDVAVFSPDDEETDVLGDEVTWTPTAADVAVVEEALEAHIEENPDLEIEGGLGATQRQYVGTGDDGDIVSVNALCEAYGFYDWEEELISVSDGGSCFWQATYSLDDEEFVTFSVNGSA
jgi:plastocyanin